LILWAVNKKKAYTLKLQYLVKGSKYIIEAIKYYFPKCKLENFFNLKKKCCCLSTNIMSHTVKLFNRLFKVQSYPFSVHRYCTSVPTSTGPLGEIDMSFYILRIHIIYSDVYCLVLGVCVIYFPQFRRIFSNSIGISHRRTICLGAWQSNSSTDIVQE